VNIVTSQEKIKSVTCQFTGSALAMFFFFGLFGKHIENISIASYDVFMMGWVWQGAKAGVLQFFDTLRVEERDNLGGITIVMPGFTESEATGGKLVDEKGDLIQDTERRDVRVKFLHTSLLVPCIQLQANSSAALDRVVYIDHFMA
jgi:hypothetical protein